jgi:phosphatidate cytidylyltransferase
LGYFAVRLTDRRDAELAALGALVAVATVSSLIWLRSIPDAGLALAGWLLGTVWATDTGAYVAGKLIGGPKLAPRVSPGKTWAGLAGGVVLAAGWGAAFALVWTGDAARSAVAAGCGAVLAQAGDLVISAVKRNYGAKDSSDMIPGHGGVLDRVAGLVTTGPLLAAMVALGSFEPWR